MNTRKITRIVSGMPATDGAGVELTRIIGQPALAELDPFLLLDAFRSDDPNDYIAGFPAHPHRGFETVTYILNGRMRHRDNAGNEGVIEAGGIQWMTAGRGIVHSEMPEQQDGLLEGFQLWINLPAASKMTAPAYQEHAAAQIPVESRPGATLRAITGTTSQGTIGPVTQPLTQPVYFDVSLEAGARFEEPLPGGHTAIVYVVEGSVSVDDEDGASRELGRDQLGVLGDGDAPASPFVMNTERELRQAFVDYQSGKF